MDVRTIPLQHLQTRGSHYRIVHIYDNVIEPLCSEERLLVVYQDNKDRFRSTTVKIDGLYVEDETNEEDIVLKSDYDLDSVELLLERKAMIETRIAELEAKQC